MLDIDIVLYFFPRIAGTAKGGDLRLLERRSTKIRPDEMGLEAPTPASQTRICCLLRELKSALAAGAELPSSGEITAYPTSNEAWE